MNEMIEVMIECGWSISEETGRIFHPDIPETFDTWKAAIRACIEVASGA